MFVNKNIAVLHATETELLFNFDNGVIEIGRASCRERVSS